MVWSPELPMPWVQAKACHAETQVMLASGYVYRCILSTNHWTEHNVPNEGARERPQELKELAGPQEEQQYEPTSAQSAPSVYTTNQKLHME